MLKQEEQRDFSFFGQALSPFSTWRVFDQAGPILRGEDPSELELGLGLTTHEIEIGGMSWMHLPHIFLVE